MESTLDFENKFPLQQQLNQINQNSSGLDSNSKVIHMTKSIKLPPINISSEGSLKSEKFKEKRSESCHFDNVSLASSMTPELRARQLESNIEFVKEHCHYVLKYLHKEVEDLKRKNKELQFQLIMGDELNNQTSMNQKGQVKNQTSMNQKSQVKTVTLISKNCLPSELSDYISKLENEVKQLKIALNEVLKINSTLKKEISNLKEKENLNENDSINNNNNNNDKLMISPNQENICQTIREFYRNAMIKKHSAFLPHICK